MNVGHTSLTISSHLAGIVRSQTQATELFMVFLQKSNARDSSFELYFCVPHLMSLPRLYDMKWFVG
jgi:hypothetical protein